MSFEVSGIAVNSKKRGIYAEGHKDLGICCLAAVLQIGCSDAQQSHLTSNCEVNLVLLA